MEKYYSSGEVAKMCRITTRTVQFYDKEDILKPSEISEGGRRKYTEEDYVKLKNICMYRSLGLSLNEIKEIFQKGNKEYIKCLIEKQVQKIDEEMLQINEKKERLNTILEQINQSGDICIKSIEELELLTQKKQKYKKTNVMTIYWIISYCLFLLSGFIIVGSIGGVAPIIFAVLMFVLLLALVYWHKNVNAYICDKCGKKFSISFIRDLLSFNGLKGKYLRCPECNTKGWCRETYPE